MRSFSLLLVAAFLFCLPVFAQQKLSIPLDPGRIAPLFDASQISGSDYLIANGAPAAAPFSGGYINMTAFNTQQGILWSRDYIFETLMNRARISTWPSENALLMATFTLDSALNKILVKTDRNGNLLWSRRFGSEGDILPNNIGETDVWPEDDGTAIFAGGPSQLANNNGKNDLYISRIDADGNLIWGRNVCFSCLNGADAAFAGLIKTQDGNYLLAGTVTPVTGGFPNEYVMLIKFDGSGNVIWSRYYGQGGPFVQPNLVALNLTERPNGRIVVVGFIESFTQDFQNGLVLETNPDGQLLQVQAIELIGTKHEVFVNNAIPVSNDQLVLSMTTRQDTLSQFATELNIIARIKTDNAIEWQHSYQPELLVGYGTNFDALIPQSGGGYAFFPNYAENFDNLFPYLIFTDADGRNGCELPVGLRVQTVSDYNTFDISPEIRPLDLQEDFDVTVPDFAGYQLNIPLLYLGPDTFACDSVSILLDATLSGADTYSWNTGAITPTLSVNAPGVYSATVSDASACLQLVDSISVAVAAISPTASILFDTSGYCLDTTLRLVAIVTDADSILWSTGETTDTIIVQENGNYFLTAFNACGIARDTVNVQRPGCPNICPFVYPNVFTPNGDTYNDVFRPIGYCPEAQDFTLKVYNRWGDLVFEGMNPADGWDGAVNGSPAPTDVYVWWAQYRTSEMGEDVLQKGDVTLLR